MLVGKMEIANTLILSCALLIVGAAAFRPQSGTHDQFWIRLADHTAGGMQVGSLSNLPILRNHSLDGAGTQLRQNRSFSIISISNPGAQYFRVDSTTGVVYTTRTVDRDELCAESYPLCCERELVCTFTFRALILVGKTQVMPLVYVSVTDQNDNPPKFSAPTIVLEVTESTESRSAYRTVEMRLPPAIDIDSKNYSIRDYRLITSDPAKFAIRKPPSLTDSSEMIVLLIREPLDREEQDRYQMTIVAYDGGQPSLSSSMNVVISVSDANDHQPVFVNRTYTAVVPEMFSVDEAILQLNATDKDDGINGQVNYEFDSTVGDDIRRLFSLDKSSGILKLAAPLDFETHRQYKFIVVAHDSVDFTKVDKATVTISVTDVNDEAPIISADALQESVSESLKPGTYVVYVQVIDSEGFAGNCSIDNPRFGIEPLDNVRQQGSKSYEFNIVSSSTLDREQHEVERIHIRCVDSFGENALEATKEINLTVSDVNDNAPVFDRTTLDVSVLENNNPNEQVVQLHADDADEGENRELRFLFSGGNTVAQNTFRIDSITGQLYAIRTLDREDKARYTLPVIVHDLGSPHLTSSATITIAVIDQNDNAPAFAASTFEFTAAEHERRGTYVGQVRASDADDSKSGGEITFSLSASNGAPFTIDPRDGILYADQELDREERDHYVFDVIATDNGHPQRSSTAVVTVRVSDKNDHPPRIRFPVGVNMTFRVSCTEQLHHTIMTINASDDDLDRNGVLTYRIASGDETLFHVDPENGSLQLNRPLTEADCGRRDKLTIEVRDGGLTSMRSHTDFHVIFDKALRPSNSDISGTVVKRPSGRPQMHDDSATKNDLDSTMETVLLVVVFAVLIAMLIITFVVIFMSRKHALFGSSFCKDCLDPEAGRDENSRNRKRATRNRRQTNQKRHNAGDKRPAPNRDSSSSEDHAAAVAALLSSESVGRQGSFSSDRTHIRNYIPHVHSEADLSVAKLEEDDNNNSKVSGSRTCTFNKQQRRRTPNSTMHTAHRSVRETVTINEDANEGNHSPSGAASEKYDSIRVVEVNQMPQNMMPVMLAHGANYYLPSHHPMNLYCGDDSDMMRENEFVDEDGSPIKMIPLDNEINPDGMVMCNVQSINYCACSQCSHMSHLEADSVASRTLIKNLHMHAMSPFREAQGSSGNMNSFRDCSISNVHPKSAATPCRAFPQIENSMI